MHLSIAAKIGMSRNKQNVSRGTENSHSIVCDISQATVTWLLTDKTLRCLKGPSQNASSDTLNMRLVLEKGNIYRVMQQLAMSVILVCIHVLKVTTFSPHTAPSFLHERLCLKKAELCHILYLPHSKTTGVINYRLSGASVCVFGSFHKKEQNLHRKHTALHVSKSSPESGNYPVEMKAMNEKGELLEHKTHTKRRSYSLIKNQILKGKGRVGGKGVKPQQESTE